MATLGPNERTSLMAVRVPGETFAVIAFTLVETLALGV